MKWMIPKTIAGIAVLWVSATLPLVVHAQFTFETASDNTITIIGHTGANTTVAIPPVINGLPVTRVGAYAFMCHTDLVSAVIPCSVTNIGRGAFNACLSLTNISFTDTATRFEGSYHDRHFDQKKLSGGCGLTSIGPWAFQACRNLVDFRFPTSLVSIEEGAFHGCESLTTAAIPDSVTLIAASAFTGCSGLRVVSISTNVTAINNNVFADCGKLSDVTIPNRFTSIGVSAFKGCSRLTSVTIPESVSNVWDTAFWSCTNLVCAYFNGNAPTLSEYVFEHDEKLTIYRLAGTTGWSNSFGGRPTAIWNPETNNTANAQSK